jgi:hypothetical protein
MKINNNSITLPVKQTPQGWVVVNNPTHKQGQTAQTGQPDPSCQWSQPVACAKLLATSLNTGLYNAVTNPLFPAVGTVLTLLSLAKGFNLLEEPYRNMRVRVPGPLGKKQQQEVSNQQKTLLNNPNATPQQIRDTLQFMHRHGLSTGEVHAPPDVDACRRSGKTETELNFDELKDKDKAIAVNGGPFRSLLLGKTIPNLTLKPHWGRNPDFAYRVINGLRIPRNYIKNGNWTLSRVRNAVMDESLMPGQQFVKTDLTNLSARQNQYPGSVFDQTQGLTYTYPNEWHKNQQGIVLKGANPLAQPAELQKSNLRHKLPFLKNADSSIKCRRGGG